MNLNEQTTYAKNLLSHEVVPVSAPEAPAYEEVTRALRGEKDVLFQFRANIQQLEDLTGRLKFVLGEVSHSFRQR